jgi:hypothetical protein
MFQRAKLIFEFLPPYRFAARAIAHGVACLDHEFANHAVEDDVVVVVVSGVGNEVFDGEGRGFGEESDRYVAVGCVEGGERAGCGGFGFFLLFGEGGGAGLFVVDVAGAFCGADGELVGGMYVMGWWKGKGGWERGFHTCCRSYTCKISLCLSLYKQALHLSPRPPEAKDSH